MKKTVIALGLCFALGFGTLGLSACTPVVDFHTISAKSSHAIQGGTVSGYGNYKTNSKVTLTATPKTEGGFLAWVKNEQIVSYDEIFTFTASDETAGEYIALFETADFEFARLEQVDYQLNSFAMQDHGVSVLDWTLKYNTMSTLYHKLANFQNELLTVNDNNQFLEINHEDKVLYSNKKYYFSLNITLEYTNLENGKITSDLITTNFFIDFSDIFDQSAVTDAGTTTYTCPDYTLTLTQTTTELGKQYAFLATFNSLETSPLWDDSDPTSNQQILTLSFIYQNPLS